MIFGVVKKLILYGSLEVLVVDINGFYCDLLSVVGFDKYQ